MFAYSFAYSLLLEVSIEFCKALPNFSTMKCSSLVLLGTLLVVIFLGDIDGQKPQKSAISNTVRSNVAQIDPKCLQPVEPGLCRMSLIRFYYDPQSNTCKEFKFGGCRGNDNKFGFMKTCEDACVSATSSTSPTSITGKPSSAASVGKVTAGASAAPIAQPNLKPTFKSPIK